MDSHKSLGGLVMVHLGCVFPLGTMLQYLASTLLLSPRVQGLQSVHGLSVLWAAWTFKYLLLTSWYNGAVTWRFLHLQRYKTTQCLCTPVKISPWRDSLNSCNVAAFRSLCACLVERHCTTTLGRHAGRPLVRRKRGIRACRNGIQKRGFV